MKKLVKGLVLSVMALFATVSLAACNNGQTPEGEKPALLYGAEISSVDVTGINFVSEGKLTVGVSTDFAPMEFIDTTKTGQDKFVGSDISLAYAMAEAFGLKLEIKAMNFDVVLTALDQGLIDVAISGFSFTAERAANYLPTKCYYEEGDGGQVFIINKTDVEKYKTLQSLNKSDVKIAVQNGSLQEFLTAQQVPNCNMIKIANLDEAIVQLEAGTYNAVCCALSVAENKVVLNNNLAIVEEPLNDEGYEGNFAWVNKNNALLQAACNKVVEEVVENNYYYMWYDEAEKLQLNLGDAAGELIPE
jgi:polar amino acid transport system substrate-binding protein